MFTYRARLTQNKLPAYIHLLHARSAVTVNKTANDIQARAKRNVPVRTGALRSSIIVRQRADRLSLRATVFVGQFYGLYVERGTRHMAARPFLEPAAETAWPNFQRLMRDVAGGM